MFHRLRIAGTAVLATVALTACGGDTLVSVQSPETITYAPILEVDLSAMTRSSTGLYTRDIVEGTGEAAVAGKTLGVRYAGFLNDGTLFDSRSSGTLPFVLGASQVIKGWDEGIVGMKTGGRRQLVVPASLAYGNAGRDPIPPGAVLIFVIDLITLQ